MSSIDAFLNQPMAPRPLNGAGIARRVEQRASGERLQGVAQPLQPIMDVLRGLDPQSREFARQLYNQAFQDADIPFQIPDLEEMELEQLKRQRESLQLRRDIAKETVLQVDAIVKSMPKDWKLRNGIMTDNLLDESPGKFIEVARGLEYEIDARTLALGGFEESDADASAATAEKKSKMEADALSREAGMLRDAASIKKAGGDVFVQEAKRILKEEEEAMGVDLFFFDTDIDEVAGARALLTAYDKLMRRTPVAMRRRATESFIKLKGDDIRDVLEEAETDEHGSIKFGTGSWDADPEAIWFVGALTHRMSRELGNLSATDILSKLGVPATQFDEASFKGMGEQIAAGLGEEFAQKFWPAIMGLDTQSEGL